MAEGAGLENRYTGNGIEGSNPSLSVKHTSVRPRDFVELPGRRFVAVLTWPDQAGKFFAVHRYTHIDGALREVPASYAELGLSDLIRIIKPESRLAELGRDGAKSIIAERALRAVALLSEQAPRQRLGVTGSILLGAEADDSDIDMVCYGRATFASARAVLAAALADGRLAVLSADDWRVAWQRRAPDLSLDEYMRHELRKGTKALLDGTRIDLSLLQDPDEGTREVGPFRKLSRLQLISEVTDASAAFDYPARLGIDHPEIPEIVIYTATYFGQAVGGEIVEASGWLEEDGLGRRRLLVGTSREAGGEWVKSVRSEK